MRLDQLFDDIRKLSVQLGMDQYFTQHGPDEDNIIQDPRRLLIILAVMAFGILAGCFYFFHAMLGFTAAISSNATAVYRPYPNTVVIYAVLPAFFGLFYVALDHFKAKTGLLLLLSPPGIAVGVLLALVLVMLTGLPGHFIKHKVNAFAAAHGYVKCSYQFDPDHLHIYALQSYVAAYGCPTAPTPQ